MFVNKVLFFITLSRKIKFGTVESLQNCQITTIKNFLRKVIQFVSSLQVDCFLCMANISNTMTMFPLLNTAAANEHIPDIKWYIRTVKEQTRSTYTLLMYRHLPRIALIHLVKNAVFWLNAFPTNNGVSKKYSP
jgi:hypothetical protein